MCAAKSRETREFWLFGDPKMAKSCGRKVTLFFVGVELSSLKTHPAGFNHSSIAPRLPGVRLEWAFSFGKRLPNQVSGVVLGEEGSGPVFAGWDPRGVVPRGALLVCCGSQHGTGPQQGDVAARRSHSHGY